MGWPSIRDYDDALQSIDLCFPMVPRLKSASLLSVDGLGLPQGASGSSAVVYQIRASGKEFALRCFTSEVRRHRERYQLLHKYMLAQRMPGLVDFEYLDEGIVIEGKAYPVLLMEWANGKSIPAYVSEKLSEPPALKQLMGRWSRLYLEMRDVCTAHGDLQHGNILIDSDGRPLLIDYDGMYTPTIAEYAPGEFGHHNYQHPERKSTRYYSQDMDAFSFLVVALSLKALAERASLWRAFHKGENLLFVTPDFANPGGTPLWRELSRLSKEVQELATLLAKSCQAPINSIVAEIDRVAESLSRELPADSGDNSWLTDIISAEPVEYATPGLRYTTTPVWRPEYDLVDDPAERSASPAAKPRARKEPAEVEPGHVLMWDRLPEPALPRPQDKGESLGDLGAFSEAVKESPAQEGKKGMVVALALVFALIAIVLLLAYGPW